MGTDEGTARSRHVRRKAFSRPGHQRGAVGIMALGALIIICGFCGLALDLSRVLNRKMEMQNAADAGALGAAIELDGTKAGITRAIQRVTSLFATPVVYGGPSWGYHQESMIWSDGAIKFAATPDGPWLTRSAAGARSEPNGLLYVQVDTAGLEPEYGQVATMFMPVIADGLGVVSSAARAVAGPSAIAVLPLGICTMRPEVRRDRSGELEEFGFRRGVSYDLMQLNPEATATGQSFLIHPFAAPGSSGASASDFNTVAPAVCTGTMAMARVMGAEISVSSPFPLNTLYQQLNSRFDAYAAPCSPDTAPPDKNIKEFKFNDGSVSWMNTAPEEQASKLYADTENKKRWTVAGPDPSPSGTKAEEWGPLWVYAKAARYASSPPSGGYTAYDKSNWNTLYLPGEPTAKSSYPSTSPYLGSGSTYSTAPSRTGVRDRRVLNVALLSCPVTGNKATVAGIGRFFMTVQADATHLYAEFAGLADEQTLRTRVRLYQ